MKILVTGVGGQLGYDVLKVLQERQLACLGADLKEFDITSYEAARHFITQYLPDVVIHCSAYTAVDAAEDNVELCQQVNATGTANIARICRELGAKMLYISTDYVFPGSGNAYYEVDSPVAPINVYGKTKLAGEVAVKHWLNDYFIVRISWVFGKNGNNFVKTMLRLGQARSEVSVVADQIGSPTYTADLAKFLCDLVVTKQYGTYHATNEGVCSWAEFAQAIFRQAGLEVQVKPILTVDYPTKAQRPLNSRLSKQKLLDQGFTPLPSWQDALKRYLQELKA
ncbi:MAG: dTDP-4-dehydrorhamnose reductase [Acidaminococcaceae bacterium]